MNIKDVLVGSFATLFVTVVGGVAVYYATKEPTNTLPVEKLVFTMEKPQKFSGEQRKLSFANLRVANLGDLVANNVIVAIELGENFKIVDKNITLSSGPAGKFTTTMIKPAGVQVHIPSLTPNEIASLSLLLEGDSNLEFDVGVKSDKSIGIEGSIVKTVIEESDRKEKIREFATVVVPLAIFLQLLLLFFVKPRIKSFIRRAIPADQSLNNTAFMYMHKGLITEARTMLEQEIKRSGADPHMLANYALALALDGDTEAAEKQFDAALFYGEQSHEKAVIFFNRAIAELKRGDTELGLQHLKEAHDLSSSEIERYAKYSDLISEILLTTPEAGEILNINNS